MADHKEDYKGHEIQLAGTGKGWKYQIPKILGSRASMLYSKKETALEIAKGIIDRFITS
jgi:chromosome segregation and condensation protein ScpB